MPDGCLIRHNPISSDDALGCALFRRGKRRPGCVKRHKLLRSSQIIVTLVGMCAKQFALVLVQACFGELRDALVIGSLMGGVLRIFLTTSPESSRVIGYRQENDIRIMTSRKTTILLSLLAWLLIAVSCNRSVVRGSKIDTQQL